MRSEGKTTRMSMALETRDRRKAKQSPVFDPRQSRETNRLIASGERGPIQNSERRANKWVAERAFIDQVRSGDAQAFSSLYEMYRENVHRFIMKRVRNRSDAEDLTQETFIQAFRSIGAFEGRSSILTWLLGIARFVHLRSLRCASRWVTATQPAPFESELGCDARTDLRVDATRSLDRCVEILGKRRKPRDQRIFRLRYFEQMSVRAIASEAGVSMDSVKTSLWRSRRALKQEFEPLDRAA